MWLKASKQQQKNNGRRLQTAYFITNLRASESWTIPRLDTVFSIMFTRRCDLTFETVSKVNKPERIRVLAPLVAR